MKATRFMRIPFFVTGYIVTEENMDDIARWCEGHVIRDTETPFVRVPVIRPTNPKQTQAYPGTWVIVSIQRGERSFKVYTEEWLNKQFFELPDEPIDKGIPELEVDDGNRVANNVRAIPAQARAINWRSAVN